MYPISASPRFIKIRTFFGKCPRIQELAEIRGTCPPWIGIDRKLQILQMHMPRKTLRKTRELAQFRDCYRLFGEESWLPVASLVLGLPGETAEDVLQTIELVESLKDYTGLMMPLFFSPIAETRLGGTTGFGKDQAFPEHWELVGLCLEYNLRHLKALHRFYSERMTTGPGVRVALRRDYPYCGSGIEQVFEEDEKRRAPELIEKQN